MIYRVALILSLLIGVSGAQASADDSKMVRATTDLIADRYEFSVPDIVEALTGNDLDAAGEGKVVRWDKDILHVAVLAAPEIEQGAIDHILEIYGELRQVTGKAFVFCVERYLEAATRCRDKEADIAIAISQTVLPKVFDERAAEISGDKKALTFYHSDFTASQRMVGSDGVCDQSLVFSSSTHQLNAVNFRLIVPEGDEQYLRHCLNLTAFTSVGVTPIVRAKVMYLLFEFATILYSDVIVAGMSAEMVRAVLAQGSN